MSARRRLILCALPLGLSLACVTPSGSEENPGNREERGTWRFTAVLEQNTCGTVAVESPEEISYEATLAQTDVRAEWQLDGADVVYGSVRSDGQWWFDRSSEVFGYDGAPVGCTYLQTERMGLDAVPEDATQDAGTTEIEGTSRTTLSTATGYDCTAALSSVGGVFLELPCVIDYRLHAVRAD
ncbi:MAG: hypothetical protein KC619_04385 [Myxococcales bacterium]|nr:hypothetical protein [Myxococcales bacterium]